MHDYVYPQIPLERVIRLAEMLGTQDVDLCPPYAVPVCWRHRDLKPYLVLGDTPEFECAECWMRYILMGDETNA